MTDEFSSPQAFRHYARGNAIVEYITPVALILLAAISIVMAIGAGLNGQFGLVKKDMNTKISAAQAAEKAHNLQKDAFQAAASATTKAGGSSSGAPSVNLSGLSPDDIAKVIQTAGANGATNALADALTKYIDQLKASGNLTPDQLSILSQLANAGHNMANAEKALQDAVDSGSGTVTYNGQTYSVADFGNQFGMSNGMSGVAGLSAANANPQTAPFLNLYAQAQSSGALGDSTVGGTVSYLSQQITALSTLAQSNIAQGQSLTNQSYAYTTANTSGSYGMGLTAPPPGTTISGATHGDSSGICTAGSGSDSGTACN